MLSAVEADQCRTEGMVDRRACLSGGSIAVAMLPQIDDPHAVGKLEDSRT